MTTYPRTSENWLRTLPARLRTPRPLDAFQRRAVDLILEGSWSVIRTFDGESASVIAIGIAAEVNDALAGYRFSIEHVRFGDLLPADRDEMFELDASILVIDLGFGDRYVWTDEHREALAQILESCAGNPERRVVLACSTPFDDLEHLGVRVAELLRTYATREAMLDYGDWRAKRATS